MGPIFLVVGSAEIAAGLALLRRLRGGFAFAVGMALATLWYLVFRTVSSLIEIVVLITGHSQFRGSTMQTETHGLK